MMSEISTNVAAEPTTQRKTAKGIVQIGSINPNMARSHSGSEIPLEYVINLELHLSIDEFKNLVEMKDHRSTLYATLVEE